MSKKLLASDPFQPKITRNDRFAQMSHQEKVIEQKKKEIQAKLDAKLKLGIDNGNVKSTSSSSGNPAKSKTCSTQKKNETKPMTGFNLFSNDGSFLDTFKQLKEKKLDVKSKPGGIKDNLEKPSSEQTTIKSSRWSQRRRSLSPLKDNVNPVITTNICPKPRVSRFSNDKPATITNFEPKITINAGFNTPMTTNYEPSTHQLQSVTPQTVTGQPLLKNDTAPSTGVATYAAVVPSQTTPSVIAAPPLLLNVPPPQLVPAPTSIGGTAVVLPASHVNVLVSTSNEGGTITLPPPPPSEVLTTVTLPPPPSTIITSQTVSTTNDLSVPPPCVPAVELASIPPPNPIQVQNIPQPEPLNALNIPHPAPIQVQNIPTPNSIQLNEIPNPKPLDLLSIPTPDKPIAAPDFLKNIPPPNKSIPPPTLPEPTNINVPPPNVNVQPPPSLIPPPPQTQNLTCQNILVHTIPPPPTQLQTITAAAVPPPTLPPQNFASVTSISVALPPAAAAPGPATPIPSLMAQPILPPPGLNVTAVNVNCPPPLPPNVQAATLQAPPPSFVTQPPPVTSQMPPMNVPPPPAPMPPVASGSTPFKDLNTGTPDYEAMASLGRMVAQCGPGIEDVVRQRKMQDPNLWFLFHKNSAAYRQYRQLVAQFVREKKMVESNETKYKPEDIYEPEMAIDDDINENFKQEIKEEDNRDGNDSEISAKRKRKSRWGDKDMSVPPPVVLNNPAMPLPRGIPPVQPPRNNGNVMISKITRSDPALIQYAINTYGSTTLTEEEWKKVEDHFKINMLYQDMVKKREELERLQKAGKNKYDYDSDEDTEGGTWEHKLRDKEMMATQLWAQELTRQAEGKHHIGDFLPPEELKRFLEKTTSPKDGGIANVSDYKEFQIKEDNIGFKMLQKLGWSEGQGLGSTGTGIIEPVNKASNRDPTQGLGVGDENVDKEDEYEAYRKRMMLAYRFRPNPLNNPRRPYY